jgi:CRISPR-associated protein Cas1
MKKHLNTLFVTTQGAYLAKENETIVVLVEKEVKLRLPVHMIGSVVCFGQVSMSSPLMGFCAERGVTVSYFTEHGHFLARVEGPTNGNVLLRREQYRRTDREPDDAVIAKAIVSAKIANSRAVLLRGARERDDPAAIDSLDAAASQLAALLTQLQSLRVLDEIRGIEGIAARVYFSTFDFLISQQKDSFWFSERSRRPPLDNLNALLSFIYTLLLHDFRGACEGVGLDPQVGFLHRERPGRPSLALDLVEEFRSWFADRLVLSLINLKQVKGSDFERTESGGVLLKPEPRKTVLEAYQKRKQEELVHPFLQEKTTIGLLPHLQALLLARHLRGDLDGYPPFFWK